MPTEPQPQRSEREKNKGLTPDGRRDAMTPLWEHAIEQPPATDDKPTPLERIAIVLEGVFDKEKGCLRMVDVDRANVYKTHLGKKLSDEK